MLNFIFDRPFPVRTKANPVGTLTLAAATESDLYNGQDARQDRAMFIITNLSTTVSLKVRNGAHKNLTTIFPQTTIALPIRDDLYVYNTSGSTACDYEVIELFYDEGSPGGGRNDYSRGGNRTIGNTGTSGGHNDHGAVAGS